MITREKKGNEKKKVKKRLTTNEMPGEHSRENMSSSHVERLMTNVRAAYPSLQD